MTDIMRKMYVREINHRAMFKDYAFLCIFKQ